MTTTDYYFFNLPHVVSFFFFSNMALLLPCPLAPSTNREGKFNQTEVCNAKNCHSGPGPCSSAEE